MIEFFVGYGVWVAIYWLLMFSFMLIAQPTPQDAAVWLMVFLMSPLIPILVVYFIIVKVKKNLDER